MIRFGRSPYARTALITTGSLLAVLLVTPSSLPAQEHEQTRDRQSSGRGERPHQPHQKTHTRDPHPDAPRPTPPQVNVPRGAPPSRSTARSRVEPHHPTHVQGVRPLWRAYPEPRFYGYDRPRVVVPCITYPHPYYAFRPRYWIGFGIYVGMGVPYPVVYGYPPYVYNDGVVLGPPTDIATYGGIAFSITPDDATVAIDGAYVGIARDFSPRHRPLTLTPGRHHVELQAPGRVPLAFDVEIVAGEVLPFEGTLQVD